MSFFQSESLLCHVLSSYKQNTKTLKLILCAQELDAIKTYELLKNLSVDFLNPEELVYVPSFFQTGVYRYESAKKAISKRLTCAQNIANGSVRIVVASISAYFRHFPSTMWVKENRLLFTQDQEMDIEQLLLQLGERGYCQVPRVEDVGDFCVRGSIVDVWTPGLKSPCRLEFFDDKIEKIRLFRVEDQRSYEHLERFFLLPAREFIWPKRDVLPLHVEKLNQYILQQKLTGVQRNMYLEDLKANIPFVGIDDLHYMFSFEKYSSLFEELNNFSREKNLELSFYSLLSNDDITETIEQLDVLYDKSYINAGDKNFLAPKKEFVFPKISEEKNKISDFLRVSKLEENKFSLPLNLYQRLITLNKEKYSNKIEKVKEILDLKDFMNRVVFCFVSANSFIEFSVVLAKYFPEFSNVKFENLKKNFDASAFFDSPNDFIFPLSDTVAVCILTMDSGFFLHKDRTLFLSENWIRGFASSEHFEEIDENDLQSRSKANSQIFLSSQFSDFSDGDYVVHIQYGIAKFRGIMTISLMGITGDFLALEFANNDKVYVPVHKLNLVQKYIGTSSSVTLDSLKGSSWEKKKEKAKKDVEKIAKELLDYQAKRSMTPGHSFSKIDEDYLTFEDAFPFDETPDQLKAIKEIMSDMGHPKPMDRLLCGDVGFGKTEVAMRAAYRCVLDGKQVAWLVPTTVLAHQHFRSLKERFQEFGVNIELMDRSIGTASKVLKKLENGEVDIVIGTHRLLSKDIVFRDLGLLVVDEEQRFGVIQKEKIKSMSYGIDVLTMTATPIPRTLQMAMTGLKELSLLNTPPKARLATKTFVCPFEDELVKNAIEQELSRGGQLFYVHNRVDDLQAVQAYLQQLLPSLRIAVGHGKMSQKELEKTILSFLDGQYEVLLCTTIIESGVDMPNVNTIIIQNADHFGLAQLYQLRGRVGRRSTRGFAYFLTSGSIDEESEGMKRLQILKDHQDLGAGFAIASQDLELRGSGNILSDDQSGKVNDIGLETYLQMLDDAIKTLGGQKVSPPSDVDIHIPVLCQIPENYIQNSKERLKTYRRFFGAYQEKVLANLLAECEDRFGALPQEAINLAEMSRVRRMLLLMGASSLTVGEDATEICLDAKLLQFHDPQSENVIKRILEVCNHKVANMRLTPNGRILFPLKKKQFTNDTSSSFQELKRVLSLLAGEQNVEMVFSG